MKMKVKFVAIILLLFANLCINMPVRAQIGRRFAAGDNFTRDIYLIDRHTHEMMLLSTGHKTTAADHPHPTFSPDGTKIQIQSAMLSEDGRSLNICIIPVPQKWLKRKYKVY